MLSVYGKNVNAGKSMGEEAQSKVLEEASVLTSESTRGQDSIIGSYRKSVSHGFDSSVISQASSIGSKLEDNSATSSILIDNRGTSKNKLTPLSSRRPATRSTSSAATSSFSSRLIRMLERPSTAPAGGLMKKRYDRFENTHGSNFDPNGSLQQFSTISRSSIANVIPSWKLARGRHRKAQLSGTKFRGGYYQKRNAESLFWVPSQPIDVYCIEKDIFRSHDRWAKLKLLESIEQSNGMSPSSVTSRHAIDILLRVTRRKIEEFFKHEITRRVIIAFCIATFDFQSNKEAFVEGAYIRCNCYFQDVKVLRDIEEEELARVPEIEEFMQKEQKDLQGCRNALTFSSRSWQKTIKGVIFKRWRDGFKAAKISEARFKEFLKKMCQPNLKPIIVGWQNYVRNDVSVQLNRELKNLERKIKYAKQQLGIIESKSSRASTNISMYKTQIENLVLAEVQEKTKLEKPGRNPRQLKLAADCLAACVLKFSTYSTNKLYHAKSDICKVDERSICLDQIAPQEGSKFAELFEDNCDQGEALEISDDDVDVVFPYDLVSGMRLAHWANHAVQSYCDKENILLNKNEDGKIVGMIYDSGEDLKCGTMFELLAKAMIPRQYEAAVEFNKKKKSNALFQAVVDKASTKQLQYRKNMLENVLRAFQTLKPVGIGNFLTIDDFFSNEDEDKQSTSSTEAHARMVTMYLGEQIEMEDNSEQLQFNFLLNILDRCCGVQPPKEKIETLSKLMASFENNFAPLQEIIKVGILSRARLDVDPESFRDSKMLTGSSAGILNVSHEHEHEHDEETKQDHQEKRKELEDSKDQNSPEETDNTEAKEQMNFKVMDIHDLSQHLILRLTNVIESLAEITSMHTATIEQRQLWWQWKVAAKKLGWRSMCHTLLSQKVAVEEHVDDGRFTNITRLQIQDILEKVGDLDQASQTKSVDEIKDLLKEHLPTLEHIFVHYCTHGSGGSNESMDRGEYWRFIRDIKIKHKRKMTSVDIDLIFTAANVDRDESDDDNREEHSQELLPVEFSECLVRLAATRFDQGPIIMRLQRLFEMHVIKYACSTNKNIFKRKIDTEQVRRVYTKFQKPLAIVYKAYASADQQDDAVNKKDSINLNEFLLMCKQLGILKSGSNVSEVAASKLFALVQGSDILEDTTTGKPPKVPQKKRSVDEGIAKMYEGTADESNAATLIQGRFRMRQAKQVVAEKKAKKIEDEQSEMSWSEFTEVIAALSCYVVTDPYKTIDNKLEVFIVEHIIIPASKFEKGGLFDDKMLRTLVSAVPVKSPVIGTGSPRKSPTRSPKKSARPKK